MSIREVFKRGRGRDVAREGAHGGTCPPSKIFEPHTKNFHFGKFFLIFLKNFRGLALFGLTDY
jgi:hypothetical protein